MKIIIAPNAFKGTITAKMAALAIAQGIRNVYPDVDLSIIPVADGGDGILDILIDVYSGERHLSIATGPLGLPVEAEWGMINEGKTVFIETARVFGLALIPLNKRDPSKTTSRGIGDIINIGLDMGIRDFMIAVGGSANNDGGTGMIKALGAKFLDENGNDLMDGGLELRRLNKIDISSMDPRIKVSKFTVLSDSTVPLTGPEGVSVMYSPGKGASINMSNKLDKALVNYADVIFNDFGLDIKTTPCGGAGGGIVCAAQVFWKDIELALGIDVVLEKLKFEDEIQGADLVITGEGRVDEQTIYDKAPIGVAKSALLNDIPVLAICANLGDGFEKVYEHGISSLAAISDSGGWFKEGSIVDESMLTSATINIFKQLNNPEDSTNIKLPLNKRFYLNKNA